MGEALGAGGKGYSRTLFPKKKTMTWTGTRTYLTGIRKGRAAILSGRKAIPKGRNDVARRKDGWGTSTKEKGLPPKESQPEKNHIRRGGGG